MSSAEAYRRQLDSFFAGLRDGDFPVPVRGRFGIYRYAYFARIRASVEADYPRLFEFLKTITDFPGGLDSIAVTRDLLRRNHPKSWTISEASFPVSDSLRGLLAEPRWGASLAEALRLARFDEAESFAGWLAEWPASTLPSEGKIAAFVAGNLRLARTKTWREADDWGFWRDDSEVRDALLRDFLPFKELLPLVAFPIGFADFEAGAAQAADPETIRRFLERGIGEGWLRFTEASA